MTDEAKGLTLTNANLWNATRDDDPASGSSPLARIVALRMKAYHVMNRTALVKAIESAMQEVDAARVELLKQHGTLGEDGQRYTFTTPEATEAFNAGFNEVLQAERTLPNVHAISLATLDPEALLAHGDVVRCGPLLVD